MIRSSATIVGATALLAAASFAVPADPGGAKSASARETVTEVRPVLTRVEERRRLDVVPGDDTGFDLDGSGLVLTFRLDLPAGRTLVDLAEPARVTARDAWGHDLAVLPAPAFGEASHVQLLHTFGEPPKGFQFTLGLPGRGAASFDLTTTLDVVTHADTRELTLDLGPTWTALDPALFDGERVEARLEVDGKNVQVQVRPGTIKASIADVILVDGAEETTTNFTMWSDRQVSYAFQGPVSSGTKARVRVRTGLRTTPLTIVLEDQPLP